MKQTIYIFSKKKSVLNYWESSIDSRYGVERFDRLAAFYDALERRMPDAVFFDYDGETEALLELLAYLGDREDAPAIMAFNSRPLFSDGVKLLRNGAKAFMNSYAAPQNINQAIEAVLGGNIWLYPEFVQMMIKQSVLSEAKRAGIVQRLSAREREIAQMVAMGMSNKEIARSADITEQTVKSHLKAIYEKVGVTTRLELAILMNREGESHESSIA